MTDLAAEGDRALVLVNRLLDVHKHGPWSGVRRGELTDLRDAIADALRERDDLAARKAEVWDLGTARIKEVMAERDALRVRAETAEADADALFARPKLPRAVYDRWRRFGDEADARVLDEWDRENAAIDAAHAAAVEARDVR